MCIYCSTNKYRKIYKNHVGPIPRDNTGRTYDIHHIDGNRDNNHPDNLMALSIQEHYELHLKQKDYNAALRLAAKMKYTPAELSKIASDHQRKLVNEGIHILLDGEIQRKSSLARSAAGTLPAQIESANGTHRWMGDGSMQRAVQQDLLAKNQHPTQKKWTCPNCGISGTSSPMYSRHHGDNCGLVNPKNTITVNGISYANKIHARTSLNLTLRELNKLLK